MGLSIDRLAHGEVALMAEQAQPHFSTGRAQRPNCSGVATCVSQLSDLLTWDSEVDVSDDEQGLRPAMLGTHHERGGVMAE